MFMTDGTVTVVIPERYPPEDGFLDMSRMRLERFTKDEVLLLCYREAVKRMLVAQGDIAFETATETAK